MTINKKVDFLESQKDESEWGEPIRVSRTKKPKSVMVSVRFSADEFKLIQEASDAASKPISAFLRENVLSDLVKERPRGTRSIRTAGSFISGVFSVSGGSVVSTQSEKPQSNIDFRSGKLIKN
jgi:hypothetical protein